MMKRNVDNNNKHFAPEAEHFRDSQFFSPAPLVRPPQKQQIRTNTHNSGWIPHHHRRPFQLNALVGVKFMSSLSHFHFWQAAATASRHTSASRHTFRHQKAQICVPGRGGGASNKYSGFRWSTASHSPHGWGQWMMRHTPSTTIPFNDHVIQRCVAATPTDAMLGACSVKLTSLCCCGMMRSVFRSTPLGPHV